MAFVEDLGDMLSGDGSDEFLIGLLPVANIALAGLVGDEAELLDGGDNDLVYIVGRDKSLNELVGAAIFLYLVFREVVELLKCLASGPDWAFSIFGSSLNSLDPL